MTMQIDRQKRAYRGVFLFTAAISLFFYGAVLCPSVPPAKADSEASSESGSESGAGGWRRRRRYLVRQQQVQKKMEMQHERAVQQNTQRQDNHMRNLKPGQVVHNYNFGRKVGHSQQNTQTAPSKQPAPTTSTQNP